MGKHKKKTPAVTAEHPLRIRIAEEHGDDILFCDGFDDCLVGVARRYGMETVAAYDYDKVIATIVDGGCTLEDAVEHFEYNIIGGWVGEKLRYLYT